jgi:hypothetical protein
MVCGTLLILYSLKRIQDGPDFWRWALPFFGGLILFCYGLNLFLNSQETRAGSLAQHLQLSQDALGKQDELSGCVHSFEKFRTTRYLASRVWYHTEAMFIPRISKQIKQVLAWKFPSVFAIALALWSSGVGAVIGDKYELAIFCFCLGGFWLGGWWILQRATAKVRPVPSKKYPSTKQRSRTTTPRWARAVIVVIITCIPVLWTLSLRSNFELSRLYGATLLPADDPDIYGACGGKYPDDLKLYLANSEFVVKRFPYIVFFTLAKNAENGEISGKTWLSLDRAKNGGLLITAEVRGEDGKVLAEISNNILDVNENRIFRTHHERPDRSTLIIKDEYGETALYLRYLNLHTIRLAGKMYFAPMRAFKVTENTVRVEGDPPFDFDNNCWASQAMPAITAKLVIH